MPNRQTIASAKYQKANDYVSKSYKLKGKVVREFAEACESKGESQASVLTRLMQNYIDENKG